MMDWRAGGWRAEAGALIWGAGDMGQIWEMLMEKERENIPKKPLEGRSCIRWI